MQIRLAAAPIVVLIKDTVSTARDQLFRDTVGQTYTGSKRFLVILHRGSFRDSGSVGRNCEIPALTVIKSRIEVRYPVVAVNLRRDELPSEPVVDRELRSNTPRVLA